MANPTVQDVDVQEGKELTLWQIIKPVNFQIYAGMVMSALSSIAWIAMLVMILPITRELISESTDTALLWRYVAILLGLVVGGILLRVFSFSVSHLGAFKLEEILRTQLTDHLAKVPLGYVVTTGSGSLKKILMDDVKGLHAFVADSTPLLARGWSAPPIIIAIMFILDWRMALIALAIFPIGIIAMRFAFRDWGEGRAAYDAANEHMNATILEYVQGMQVVRTFDDGTSSFSRYSEALNHATDTMRDWAGRSRYGAFIARIIFGALPTMAILVPAGIWMLRADLIDLPTLLVFLLLAPTVAESVVPVIWLSQLIIMASAGAKRIGLLLQVPILEQAASPQKPQSGSVEFKNVTFTYATRSEPALKDVSINMPQGSVTALVGPSGAGKSTVARLIPRFWDVDSGEIKVGGVNVRDIGTDDLMQHVSFVFQNPFLLHDTIFENIRLGKPNASEAEVYAAAKAAQAHDFIVSELPDGYQTKAGDRGTRLSGGQRQRITIARAILQNNPIVVLDEATAFADPENEAKIHAALAHLTAGKTLIVVAHRLSTIKDAHQIVVIDKGTVAEVGKHDELVTAGGIYAGLWAKFEEAQGWGIRKEDESTETTAAD
ncbi:MAG: ABC transporter ATP-binding protein [Chloroflexota bacterium]